MAVAAGLAGVNWGQHLGQAWQFAQQQSQSFVGFVSALPATCKLATMHAASICIGQVPEYWATPGFPPITLAWGWLLVGILIGSLLTMLILSMGGCLRREPTIGTLAAIAMAQAAQVPIQDAPRPQQPPPGLPAPRDRARDDIVAFLARDGRQALTELAAASGMTEVEFLHGMFGNGPRQRRQIHP